MESEPVLQDFISLHWEADVNLILHEEGLLGIDYIWTTVTAAKVQVLRGEKVHGFVSSMLISGNVDKASVPRPHEVRRCGVWAYHRGLAAC